MFLYVSAIYFKTVPLFHQQQNCEAWWTTESATFRNKPSWFNRRFFTCLYEIYSGDKRWYLRSYGGLTPSYQKCVYFKPKNTWRTINHLHQFCPCCPVCFPCLKWRKIHSTISNKLFNIFYVSTRRGCLWTQNSPMQPSCPEGPTCPTQKPQHKSIDSWWSSAILDYTLIHWRDIVDIFTMALAKRDALHHHMFDRPGVAGAVLQTPS